MLKRIIVFLGAVLLGLSFGQSARNLAMGGVTLPDRSASTVNPAYAAPEMSGPGTELPLPLGLINALTSSAMNPSSSAFDLLPIIDQASNLSSYILNLPSSPEEITLGVQQNTNGDPSLALSFAGGSNLIFGLSSISFGTDYAIPVNFAVGPIRLGLRPYLFIDGTLTPDANMQAIFAGGTNKGNVNAVATAEAGVALDVFYASKLPNSLFQGSDFKGDLYVGVRGAPFVGLARVDGSGVATVEASMADTGLEASYSYEGMGFLSSVATGQLGYGFVTDLGVAVDIPVDNAKLSFGLGLNNIGVAFWSGNEYVLSGDQTQSSGADTAAAVTRTYFAPNFGAKLNTAYAFEVSPMLPLLLAADVGYRGNLSTHVGAEMRFDLSGTGLAARAGLGYDNGLMLGLGTGVSAGGFQFDLALNSHRAPFTNQQSFGITASVGF